MMLCTPAQLVWMDSEKWYRKVENSYEYELTDEAPEKARQSYALYKADIDKILAEENATPYDGIIID